MQAAVLRAAANPSTDLIDCGTGGNWNGMSLGTVMCWFKFNTLASGRYIIAKRHNVGAALYGWGLLCNNSSGLFRFESGRVTSSTIVTSTFMAAEQWYFVAARWDQSLTATDQQIFWGTPSVRIAEASYGSQLLGSGAIQDDAADHLNVLNAGNTTFGMGGEVAWAAVWREYISFSSMVKQQASFDRIVTFNPPIFWMRPGTKIGLQRDLSGHGNHGVVSGPIYVPTYGLPAVEQDELLMRRRAAFRTVPLRRAGGLVNRQFLVSKLQGLVG